jgi:hypothetical protein
MSDLTTHVAYTCDTNGFWETEVTGSKGDKYTVKWSMSTEPRIYGTHVYSCTCKGFQFRGRCKHIKQVAHQRCGWNPQPDPGLQPDQDKNGSRICPECGGPATAMRVAV